MKYIMKQVWEGSVWIASSRDTSWNRVLDMSNLPNQVEIKPPAASIVSEEVCFGSETCVL